MAEEKQEKRRILYVDRAPKNERIADAMNNILAYLRREYNVEIQADLSRITIELINERAKKNEVYDALITHVPYSRDLAESSSLLNLSTKGFYEKIYGGSMEILRRIRRDYPKMPIVAYTGADNNDDMANLLKEVADEAVFKSDEWESDAKQIEMNLEKLLARI